MRQVVVRDVGAVAAASLRACGAVGLGHPRLPCGICAAHHSEGVVENGSRLTAAWNVQSNKAFTSSDLHGGDDSELRVLCFFTFDCEVLDAALKHDPAPFLQRGRGAAHVARRGLGVRLVYHGELLQLLQAEQHFGLFERDRRDGTCADVCRNTQEKLKSQNPEDAKRPQYEGIRQCQTCGVEASQLAVDAVDVEPGGDLFALFDASVGAQRAG